MGAWVDVILAAPLPESRAAASGLRLMSDIRGFDDILPGDVQHVGGKGLSLGLMARAGLPVPSGFCICTTAHRRVRGRLLQEDPLADAVVSAYRRLGAGLV